MLAGIDRNGSTTKNGLSPQEQGVFHAVFPIHSMFSVTGLRPSHAPVRLEGCMQGCLGRG
eukprot:1160294-Pelagomonas_calceolata.AAC.2